MGLPAFSVLVAASYKTANTDLLLLAGDVSPMARASMRQNTCDRLYRLFACTVRLSWLRVVWASRSFRSVNNALGNSPRWRSLPGHLLSLHCRYLPPLPTILTSNSWLSALDDIPASGERHERARDVKEAWRGGRYSGDKRPRARSGAARRTPEQKPCIDGRRKIVGLCER